MIIKNDNTINTIITLQLDATKINHKNLNNFISELEDLSIKYSIAFKEGDSNR